MSTLSVGHQSRLKRSLVRLVHVLLTHADNKSESKVAFCRRCAWDVEMIIDELEHPGQDGLHTAADAIDSYLAARKRILQRIRLRPENDWADVNPHFAAVYETADADTD